MGILDRLGKDNKKRRFGAWQVEITTRCNLECTMCVKTACKGWRREDMDVDNFRKIVPYLHDVKSVVLEGWGESLLHRNLVDFIRLSKTACREVGFVTSGMGLTEDYAHRIVDAGIDFMGFSLSGGIPATHNAIRVNSDFNTLIESIKTITRLCMENPLRKPRIHIVYLMLKDNMHEIPTLIDLAHEIGIREIVLLSIIQVTSRAQDDQKVFTCEEGLLYKSIMKKAEDKARKMKITLSVPAVSSQDVAVCSENPLDNLYISVDGQVSPCVYLYPPVPSPFTRIFCGTEYSIDNVSFGNIFNEPFEQIWERRDYREFRKAFQVRQNRWRESYSSLLEMHRPVDGPLPQPPPPCRTCHKMLGF
jgi:MoaA/NifB/PqqE/SkfB family radical SAM enzyme